MENLIGGDIKSCNLIEAKVARGRHLAEKIVFVDGQPGCGKSMLCRIVAALDRVELYTYSYEIEYVCSLYYLNKITSDAANTLIRMFTDVQLYNTMMSREINFRPTDVSSVFRDAAPLRYIRRLFQKGDEAVPSRIEKEKPILNLVTHNLTSFSEPIFSALGGRVVFIEAIRHPLYMIKQQTLNMRFLNETARDFTIYFSHNGREVPYYAAGWEDLFIHSNSVEKAIYSMEKLTILADKARKTLTEKYNAQILTIPFECFVVDPWDYLEKIKEALGARVTAVTRKVMKKQHVPRKMYADGPAFKIYKRCGWQPPQSSSENHEFEIRRRFVQERASKEAMLVLDRICAEYEEKYMGGSKKKGNSYE